MKNENKTTGVLILIFSGKNTFWNQRKSLKSNLVKLFISLRQVNHICRPSFYIQKGYKKEILGSRRMKIQNIANKNLHFWLLHTCTWEVIKNTNMCFVCKWNFQLLVIFTRSKGKKQYINPVPSKFLASWYVKVRDKARTASYQIVRNKWKRDCVNFVH